MDKNGKVISMESTKPVEDRSPEEQKKWFGGYATREEVTSFVDGYINNEVIPVIMQSVGKEMFTLRCRNEVLLKYLIDKGLCTSEEFEADYKKYLKEQQDIITKRQEELRKQQESKIIIPDKSIIH